MPNSFVARRGDISPSIARNSCSGFAAIGSHRLMARRTGIGTRFRSQPAARYRSDRESPGPLKCARNLQDAALAKMRPKIYAYGEAALRLIARYGDAWNTREDLVTV
jgi:hypothetical protein